MKRIARLAARIIVSLFVVIAACVVLFPDAATTAVATLLRVPFRSAVVRSTAMYASGRTNGCSLSQTLKAVRYTEGLGKNKDEISRASKLLKQDGGLELWSTPDGEFWAPSGDRDGTFGAIAEQREDIYEHSQGAIHSGDVVLDVGAHIGSFTRKALAAGASLVIAVEPAPDNLECLRRNLTKETSSGRVLIVPKGVMDKDGTMQMRIFHNWNSGMHSFAIEWEKGLQTVTLPVTTIDNLANELKLPRLNFIKMDIEGAERNALAGAQSTIRKFRPRLSIAAYHLPDDPTVLTGIVTSAVPTYSRVTGNWKEWFPHEIRPETLLFY